MTGCGKTTVGKELAQLTGMEFLDLDDEIVKGEGRSTRELFDTFGEEIFRDLEHEYLKSALEKENTIISCGGGIILRKENRDLLKTTMTVRIIRPRHLVEQNTNVFLRPPINGSRENYIRIYESRIPFYRQSAAVTIYNTDSKACAEELFAMLSNQKSVFFDQKRK